MVEIARRTSRVVMLLLASALSHAEGEAVNLVCDFEPVDLGLQTHIPRLRGAPSKPNPSHFAFQVTETASGPFGGPWSISESNFVTVQPGESDHALSSNRIDGTATYMAVYSSREGHFKILYPGSCKKADKPMF